MNSILKAVIYFDKPFITNGKVLAIQELWKIPEDDDVCYYQYISPYCENYFSTTNTPDDSLDIMDKLFLEGIEKCGKLALFFYNPVEVKSQSFNKFYDNPIYQEIEKELIFIGFNAIGGDSAMLDGYYPIYLDDDIRGNIVSSTNTYLNQIKVNKLGLIDSLEDCMKICNFNNTQSETNQVYWFPQKLFVDRYTYSMLQKLSQQN